MTKLSMDDYVSSLGRTLGVSLFERIEDYTSPEPMSGCHIWLGSCDDKGYAHITITDRTATGRRDVTVRVHRFNYIRKFGPVAKGIVVRHKCDMRCCVNPDHLVAGTQRDNVADMIARGRHRPGRGERHGNSVLTEERVEAIRLLYEKHEYPLLKLARIFSVNAGTIRRVVDGVAWRHI